MHIRVAVPADAAAIARVNIDTWRTAYRGLMADDFLDGLNYEKNAARWHETLSGGERIVMVAEAEAAGVVGFASGGPERTGESPYSRYAGELYALYVLDVYHGRGIGRKLVAAFARELASAGMRSMVIWVLRDNPARGFYEALGGTMVGSKDIAIGGTILVEVAYGWPDTAPLLEGHNP